MKILGCLLIVIFVCCNCNLDETSKKPALTDEVGSLLQLDKRIMSTDSVVLVFFDDPFMQDSLRYTRFFRQYSTTSATDVKIIMDALKGNFEKRERPLPCRNEGKAWLFSQSKIFQTIYFAWNKNNCAFIYLIKDGFFYYTSISTPLVNALAEYKTKSVKPR